MTVFLYGKVSCGKKYLGVYNLCMRKLKIFTTVFVLYEFVMLTVLQINRYCLSWFNLNFCEYATFKYFLMCVVVPISIALLIWWMPEISRLFCHNKCQCEQNKPESVKDAVHEIISKQDIERLIMAAVVMGVQKFVTNHPMAKETFADILKVVTKSNKKTK